ncbi:hypothetical protein FZEAL_1066 [Fusarium zealandicum]|uniref:Acid phosphatase n=1 Tax=Fusarium zealandicum TaxID=1053134 RepID=A0A8H4UTH3_9HYPO|nr:hypothetical protein FZEAL_1066 [Fusarium zealandicum]
MLPEPTLTLTLPSIHDGLVLDCRVYHSLSLSANPRAPAWQRHAAIVAHPYAPMGGSYDDPVVETVAEQLLRKGFLVGTFNFRGAHGSAGRTSWTSKPERDDYATFVAFMLHYVHHLDPFRPHSSDSLQPPSPARPTPVPVDPVRTRPVLLMGGYSYGAMVTTLLPPLDAILQPFVSPIAGSDAAEVRLRAAHLAEQQNIVLGSARAAMIEHRTIRGGSKRGVRIGGDESGSPRKSHESHGRRSFSLDEEKLRRGVHDFIARARSGRHSQKMFHSPVDSQSSTIVPPPPGEHLPTIPDLTMPQPAYLMISPLQGLITHLATMSLLPSALGKNKDPHDVAAEEKLVMNPGMAVFGDTDVFVAAHRLRAWTARLKERTGSRFRGHEVTTAGHFWAEEGVLYKMSDVVGGFAEELLSG